MAMTTETKAAPLSKDEVLLLRADFPILGRSLAGGRPLVYLDTAATSQKPVSVIQAIADYYTNHNANVHRGVHQLGTEATDVFEQARLRIAKFIDADPRGIIFVRNATEGINLVANAYAREKQHPGDRLVVTEMEHHSNFVPWQLAATRAKLGFEMIGVTSDGKLDSGDIDRLLQAPTKLLAVTHHSNVLGTVNPIQEICSLAHANGVLVAVDAAQSVPHMPVSVRDLDCDFFAFSGHKMLGPMGIGVVWVRPELLEQMPPFLGGGSMIAKVTLEKTTYNVIPHKFEAGTPDVASAAGLVAACDYLDKIGLERIESYEKQLVQKTFEVLDRVGGINTYGPHDETHSGMVSFNLDDIHAHDIGTIVDQFGVEIRVGHHCCQPLMRKLDIPAAARASVYFYNTPDEIEALGEALTAARGLFSPA